MNLTYQTTNLYKRALAIWLTMISGSLVFVHVAASQEITDAELYSGHWVYSSTINKMTDKPETMAVLASDKQIANSYLDTPVNSLLAIADPDTLIMITTNRAVFDCYSGCLMLARFDEQKPMQLWLDRLSPDTVRVSDPKKFMKRMVAAHSVKLQMPYANMGATVFTFEVSGYDASRFPKP